MKTLPPLAVAAGDLEAATADWPVLAEPNRQSPGARTAFVWVAGIAVERIGIDHVPGPDV